MDRGKASTRLPPLYRTSAPEWQASTNATRTAAPLDLRKPLISSMASRLSPSSRASALAWPL